jgi:hypothetical protein
MNRPRQAVGAPSEARPSGRTRAIDAGDPLVRALAVCIRQAHARRVRAARVDS